MIIFCTKKYNVYVFFFCLHNAGYYQTHGSARHCDTYGNMFLGSSTQSSYQGQIIQIT